MAGKIFVSYNFKDREVAFTVKGRMQSVGGTIHGDLVFVEDDVSANGSSAIEKAIGAAMNGCDAALFVVGDNSHNSPWINREAERAVSMGLSIVVTRLPRSSGGIPNTLRNAKFKEVEWDGSDLANYLNRV